MGTSTGVGGPRGGGPGLGLGHWRSDRVRVCDVHSLYYSWGTCRGLISSVWCYATGTSTGVGGPRGGRSGLGPGHWRSDRVRVRDVHVMCYAWGTLIGLVSSVWWCYGYLNWGRRAPRRRVRARPGALMVRSGACARYPRSVLCVEHTHRPRLVRLVVPWVPRLGSAGPSADGPVGITS